MINFFHQLSISTEFPLISAFVLGLLMALNPCPIITSVSAIGYINKDSSSERNSLLNGIYYTLGRGISYILLAFILIFIIKKGTETDIVQHLLTEYGEITIGVVLIIMGLIFSGIFRRRQDSCSCHGSTDCPTRITIKTTKKTGIFAFLLGMFFALAFCPYGAVLFFGILIPFASVSPYEYAMIPIFALGTAIPVFFIVWLMVFSYSRLTVLLGKFKKIEKRFSQTAGLLLVLAGVYMLYHTFFKHTLE